jgi:hypothetical protein
VQSEPEKSTTVCSDDPTPPTAPSNAEIENLRKWETEQPIVVHAHTERMAVSKERMLEQLINLEKERAHAWAKSQQSCDRLAIEDVCVDFNTEKLSYLAYHAPLFVWTTSQSANTNDGRRSAMPADAHMYVCGASGEKSGVYALSAFKVSGVTAMTTFSIMTIVRLIAMGSVLGSIVTWAVVPQFGLTSFIVGGVAGILAVLIPKWRLYRRRSILRDDYQYNEQVRPSQLDLERAAIGAAEDTDQHTTSNVADATCNVSDNTATLGGGDSSDKVPPSFILDPELHQALNVLDFDCATVATNNLSVEDLKTRRNSLI